MFIVLGKSRIVDGLTYFDGTVVSTQVDLTGFVLASESQLSIIKDDIEYRRAVC